MKIIKVENITVDLIKIFNLGINDELYSLELEDKNIGYGLIRENLNNKIEVYILSDYQGKGYGTRLFKELLKMIGGDVSIQVDIKNIIMRKILMKCDAIEIGRNGQTIRYIIPNKRRI